MTAKRYSVWDVSSWPLAVEETAGGEEKAWLADPATGELWLFKPVTCHDWRSDQGEDWAERVVAEVATYLRLPCARVELAEREGRRGSLSKNLCPPGWELHHGSVVLSGLVTDYQPGAVNPRGRPGHSVSNIRRALSGLHMPPCADVPSTFDAFDIFAGYLMLDALVATVQKWIKRGTAWRFEHQGKPVSLVQIAAQGSALAQPAARLTWLERLHALDVSYITSVISMVPELSDAAATFAVEVMRANRGRLLDDC